jgi:energy-coupling factor transporter ATP-binding protein EcfA2
MTDKLKIIFNACDPNEPADANYYIDCQKARGGDLLARKVKKRLDFLSGNHLRFLFTGHIGSGKSSELKHLANKLENANEAINFFPVYVDVSDYLNFQDVTLDEIFLAIAVEIADAFHTKHKITLKDNYFRKKIDEIKDILTVPRKISKVEVGLPFGIGKTEIQEIKSNDEAKQKLKDAINTDSRSLLDELNLFISNAELQLKKETTYSKLVIIVDSLEKIQKFEGKGQGLESQKELFIERNTKLTEINAHIIYTVPLSLCRSIHRPLLSQYYGEPLVLPMVKTHYRGEFDKPFPEGCKAFENILTKRLDKITLDETFEQKALEYLIKYCGGSIRFLMMFIQEAIISTDELPITFDVARKSIQPTVRSYASSIKETYWDKLAELDVSDKQQIDNGDEEFWLMLENLTVMEYVNGDETDSLDDLWYAVNPVLYEIGKFNTAKDNLAKKKRKGKK